MATQEILRKYGTQLLFADHATDFGAAPATAANSLIIGSPTDVQMNLSILAAAAMWQSAKTATLAKVGSAWPPFWRLGACIESHATPPTAGGTFDFYWNPSPSATAGTGNSGGCSGTDLTYTAAGINQLIPIGSLTVRNVAVNIDNNIGFLRLPDLYGSLVIVNNTDAAMPADADADETHITLTPMIDDIQAAA